MRPSRLAASSACAIRGTCTLRPASRGDTVWLAEVEAVNHSIEVAKETVSRGWYTVEGGRRFARASYGFVSAYVQRTPLRAVA